MFFSTLKIIHAHLYSHADTTPAQNVKVKNDMHIKYKDGSSQKYAEKDRPSSVKLRKTVIQRRQRDNSGASALISGRRMFTSWLIMQQPWIVLVLNKTKTYKVLKFLLVRNKTEQRDGTPYNGSHHRGAIQESAEENSQIYTCKRYGKLSCIS
jgi:hypothetical protein